VTESIESGTTDILVLRQGAIGMSTETYADALRRELPDWTITRAATPAEELALAAKAPIITGHRFPTELLEAAENLELFACAAAGRNHLPVEQLAANDVTIVNASGVHGPNIAEHVLANLLSFARNLHISRRRAARREWRRHQVREFAGSTVTVVGLGATGQAVVERLEPFNVHTVGVRYTPSKSGPTDEVIGFDRDSLHDALARTTYLVIACPLTETTEGLIGAAEFATLLPDAVLVNVARGPIVDTEALVDAIRGNTIRGAALDVTDPEPLPEEHPLWNFGNVQITPHNSGHTPAYYDRLAQILTEAVRDQEPRC